MDADLPLNFDPAAIRASAVLDTPDGAVGATGGNARLLEKHTAVRKGRVHDGKVMVMRSNLRWCSDGLEFTC